MTTYRQAGVDIEAGDALVERLKPLASRTRRPEVVSGIGGFGGLFAIPPGKYKEPVLVSGTDGVGTKLKLAFQMGRHDTVGVDLVAMSVNDILTCGAEPLFFLDYFATSKLNVDEAASVIAGIADGCEDAGCTLLGGETAELPGFYQNGEYDLAGFAVGVVEKAKIIDGKTIQPGDAVIGLASSGLHSNGYSLARKILFEDNALPFHLRPPGFERTLGDALMAPTRIYVKAILELIETVRVKGMAHITGGGIPGNLPRCLPFGTKAVLEENQWKKSPLFDLISETGKVERAEMFRTFNMGLGMLVVVPSPDVPAALRRIKSMNIDAWEVGRIEKGLGEPEAIVQP